MTSGGWPSDADALVARQQELADARAPAWQPPEGPLRVAGCWVCFPRGLSGPGGEGDPAWTAAVVLRDGALVEQRVGSGLAGAPYVPGLLALRIGPLLERAVRALSGAPDVLLVDGTSRDHPRRAGLALHLGAELGLPTVGVTHRPLVAAGAWPEDRRGATSPLRAGGEVVASWLRTRPGTRPLVVHPGWGVDLTTALEVVGGVSLRRTPEPLRLARHAARLARNAGEAGAAAAP
jgi:deoxyribonuclease V